MVSYYQTIYSHIEWGGKAHHQRLEKVKWHLWHGNGNTALERLASLVTDITDKALLEKLDGLRRYIENNLTYLVNYQERQAEGLHFTSTLAEVTVDNIINSRQKRSQKMQWSREGAHDVLQLRTSLFSKTWAQDWSDAQSVIYKKNSIIHPHMLRLLVIFAQKLFRMDFGAAFRMRKSPFRSLSTA